MELDEVAERIRSLAEAACAKHGVDLVDAEVKRGRTSLVRVTIDTDEGVDLDTCAEVSNMLSRLLDSDDPLPERFTLEVASPGADRPLKTPRDFRRNIGRELEIQTSNERTRGECIAADDGSVTISTEAGEETFALSNIEDARVVLPW